MLELLCKTTAYINDLLNKKWKIDKNTAKKGSQPGNILWLFTQRVPTRDLFYETQKRELLFISSENIYSKSYLGCYEFSK